MIEKDGSCYVGQWKDGEKNGMGKSFDHLGNTIFDGEWKGNQLTGNGTIFTEKKTAPGDGVEAKVRD